MNAEEVFEASRARGVALTVVDGAIHASPPGVLDSELKARIRELKPELVALLAKWAAPSNLEELRRLCPLIWREVVTKDGRRGLLWAVHGYGAVVVSFDPKGPLYTLDPSEVFAVNP